METTRKELASRTQQQQHHDRTQQQQHHDNQQAMPSAHLNEHGSVSCTTGNAERSCLPPGKPAGPKHLSMLQINDQPSYKPSAVLSTSQLSVHTHMAETSLVQRKQPSSVLHRAVCACSQFNCLSLPQIRPARANKVHRQGEKADCVLSG